MFFAEKIFARTSGRQIRRSLPPELAVLRPFWRARDARGDALRHRRSRRNIEIDTRFHARRVAFDRTRCTCTSGHTGCLVTRRDCGCRCPEEKEREAQCTRKRFLGRSFVTLSGSRRRTSPPAARPRTRMTSVPWGRRTIQSRRLSSRSSGRTRTCMHSTCARSSSASKAFFGIRGCPMAPRGRAAARRSSRRISRLRRRTASRRTSSPSTTTTPTIRATRPSWSSKSASMAYGTAFKLGILQPRTP